MVMEGLEPRVLLTTYTVTSVADSGPGSLRDAIQQANGNPGPNEIDISLGSGAIVLEGQALEISGNVTIEGVNSPVIDGNASGSSSVFVVDEKADVTLDGLAIKGGNFGVENSGTLTISNCQISDNSRGVENSGTLTISNCQISDNSGGGISNGGELEVLGSWITGNSGNSGSDGGGIANSGVLTLSHDTIAYNSSSQLSELVISGGLTNGDFGTVTISDSRVYGNYRGGVLNRGSMTMSNCAIGGNSGFGMGNQGTLSVTGGSISGNDGYGALNSGAGMGTLTDVMVSGNNGPGIFNAPPTTELPLSITGCTISDNSSSGILNEGFLTALATEISGNTGGGIDNTGWATLVNSTVSDNRSFGSGGGIENAGWALDIVNSTISGNAAFGSGGGIDTSDYGTLEVDDSTVSNNRASVGGGICITASPGYPHSTVLRNTIVAGDFLAATNTPNDIAGLLDLSKSQSDLIGTGGSGGLANGVNGNLVGVADPKLAPLGDYGGPTSTMPPLAGSPAIDAGNNALAVDTDGNPLTTDQRGQPRVLGTTVDIGAVEVTQLAGSQLYLREDSDGLNLDVWQDSPTPGVGAPTVKLPLSELPGLALSGTAGNDTLTFDFSNGGLLGTTLSYDGGAGNNTLRIIGTSGNDTIDADTSEVTAYANNGLAVAIFVANLQTVRFQGGSGGNDTLAINGGTYTVDASTPATAGKPNVSVEVGSGVVAKLTGDQHLAGLTFFNGGLLEIGSSKVWTTTPAATIRGYLKSGYGPNQDWTGTTGITSSVAAGDAIKYTIGYADGNDQSAQDAGIAVSPGQVLVQPTLVGDANLDGTVNFLDLSQPLGYKFNTHQPASYTDGDLNYDGVVDFFDLATLLSANYNTGQSFAAAAAAANTASAATPVAAPLSAEAATSAMPPVPGSAVQGTPFSRLVIPEIDDGTPGATPVLSDWPAAKKRRQIFADG
jgi:hypothetical protein